MTVLVEPAPYLMHELRAERDDTILGRVVVPLEGVFQWDRRYYADPPNYPVVYQPVKLRMVRSGLMRFERRWPATC